MRCFDFAAAMEAAERAQAGRVARAARRRAGRLNPKPRRGRPSTPARPAERAADAASDGGAGDCGDDGGLAKHPDMQHGGSPGRGPAEGCSDAARGSGVAGVSELGQGRASRDAAGSRAALTSAAASQVLSGTPSALAQAAAQQDSFGTQCMQGMHMPPFATGYPCQGPSGGDGAAAGGSGGPDACQAGSHDAEVVPWGTYAGRGGAGSARCGGGPGDTLPCGAPARHMRSRQCEQRHRQQEAGPGEEGGEGQGGAQQLAGQPPPVGRACRASGQSGMQAWAIVRPRQAPVGGASGRSTRARD